MAKKQPKTLKELCKAAPVPPEVPWEVHRFLGSKRVDLLGDQVSFGEGDYGTVAEFRVVIDWYVHQFGGKVKWS